MFPNDVAQHISRQWQMSALLYPGPAGREVVTASVFATIFTARYWLTSPHGLLCSLPGGCYVITGCAAGGCQYLPVKMAARTQAVSI
jgi:hypothetical protein